MKLAEPVQIGEIGRAMLVDKNVRGFYVAMNNCVVVSMLDSLGNRDHPGDRAFHIRLSRLQPLFQRQALDILTYQAHTWSLTIVS